MTTSPQTSFARLHDGVHPVSRPVELELRGDQLHVDEQPFAVGQVLVSPRTGSANRFVSLPNGWELQVPDAPWLDQLPVPEQGALLLPWLEARAWVAAGSLVGIVAFAVWFWFLGLPVLAAFAARHVPFGYEQRLGRESLAALDQSGYFAPTELQADDQADVAQRFQKLVSTLAGAKRNFQLELRRAEIGPNAIALPGHIIVVTDDLVELCSGDEVSAVMAHELAHSQEHHVMRGYFVDAGLAALTRMLWGSADTGAALETGSLQLLQLGYSRELEQAADDGAFAILRRAQLPPALLGDALERISHPTPARADSSDDDGEGDDQDDDSETSQAGAALDDEAESDEAESDEAEGNDAQDEHEPAAEDGEMAANPSAQPPNWVELGDTGSPVEPAEPTEPAEPSARDANERVLPDLRKRAEQAESPEDSDDDPLESWRRQESWSFLSTHPVTAERIARARAQHL